MRLAAPAVLVLLGLIGCSGGDGGGGGTAPPPRQPNPTLSGTVAANQPLASYQVDVQNVREGRVLSGGPQSGADGRYSAILGPGDDPPFVLRASRPPAEAEPQYPRLYSVSNHTGTVQVTPLTSLLVARLLNRKPAYLVVDRAAVLALQGRSDAELAAARQQVLAYLLTRPDKENGGFIAPVDVSAVTDFVTMPLKPVPGDPHFEALQRLHASLMDTETIEGVEEHMLFRNDPPADLRAILALDFLANCTVEGIDDGTLPRGPTRIIFARRGVTFGNVDFPFLGGELFRVSKQFSATSWQIESTARRTRVDLSVFDEDGLVTASLSRPIGDSTSSCQALGEVPLAGKVPSLMALLRLLGQSVFNASFQCAAPVAAGFRVGTNLLNIEQNGALRINGPGGPSLHLLSQDLRVTARLAVMAGEVAPIRVSLFGATRVLRGGSNVFSMSITPDGLISSVSFGRDHPPPRLSQNCGILLF